MLCQLTLGQLTTGDFASLAGVIVGGFAVLTTCLALYLRSLSRSLGGTVKDLQGWLQRVDERVAAVERDSPLFYVSKDEWLRAMNGTQELQDKMVQKLVQLDTKVDSQVGLAAQLSANTTATAKLASAVATAVKQMASERAGQEGTT